MKKIIILILTFILSISTFGCGDKKMSEEELRKKYGNNYSTENTKANQEYLFGMCDIAWSNDRWNTPPIDYKMSSKLMNNLGVKSVRNWMHCNWLMSDKDTFKAKEVAFMHEILKDLEQYNFQIIGMNHSNFHLGGYTNSSKFTAKPSRNLEDDSMYLKWLDDYKTTWKNLSSEFKEITYWEIDNEPNNNDFMQKLEGGTFSLKEKAEIYTDMMYYASLGIHEGNPNAITVMGGMIPDSAETFLQYIYDQINGEFSWSKFADDYFQIACWHPYMNTFTPSKFEETNKGIYDIVLKNEGKDKKVFFTELGWSEGVASVDKICENITSAYTITKEKLKFVENIHYFRIYDDLSSSWGSIAEKKFGLFTDPVHGGKDSEYEEANPILCAPKSSAYAYQKIAGGKGDLTIYQEAIMNKNK